MNSAIGSALISALDSLVLEKLRANKLIDKNKTKQSRSKRAFENEIENCQTQSEKADERRQTRLQDAMAILARC